MCKEHEPAEALPLLPERNFIDQLTHRQLTIRETRQSNTLIFEHSLLFFIIKCHRGAYLIPFQHRS